MSKEIKRVAVLGAGVMGQGIAAHLANAGIQCYLLDIVPGDLTDDEKMKGLTKESPEFRNKLSNAGLQALLKAKPALLFTKNAAKLITPGNFEDDMDKLADVDWVCEAIIENLDIKKSLFKKVASHTKPGTIISSNTSGIKISEMVEGMPADFASHFLVTHFFNPVRYMKLLEIVVGEATLPEVTSSIVNFGEDKLGKGIVYAKDTPNFIGNRIGVYGLLATIKHMKEDGLEIDEVDAIAGKPMGKPKSAAFRTMDMVGMDTIHHVVVNLYDALTDDDDEKELFKLHPQVDAMIEKGLLGQKTKAGFYKRVKGEGGKKEILVLDLETLEYRSKKKYKFDSIGNVRKIDDPGERMKALLESSDKAADFAWKVTRDSLLYTAKRVPEIADDIVNIDNAMKWGYNWEQGPFEIWDSIGVAGSISRMKEEGFSVPSWVEDMLGKGCSSFYKFENGITYFYDIGSGDYKKVPVRPEAILLKSLAVRDKVIRQNPSAVLYDMDDGIICVEFRSKMNAVDEDILNMVIDAVDLAEKDYRGVVIGNQGENFCVGANILLIYQGAMNKNWDAIGQMVDKFQEMNQRLKYSAVPTVTAPFGLTLGGGCEVSMGANRIYAHAETYMGLVELGVGLIPAGGGCKELVRRTAGTIPAGVETETFPFIRKAFETIGMAKVSFSGELAREHGYMAPDDVIVMNRDFLLHDAKMAALGMAEAGFDPGRPRADIPVPGKNGFATLKLGLMTMRQGNYISEFDEKLGLHLSRILTGGDVANNEPVSEEWLLQLEKEAFLSLCGEQKTLDRISHMLMHNKPLRN